MTDSERQGRIAKIKEIILVRRFSNLRCYHSRIAFFVNVAFTDVVFISTRMSAKLNYYDGFTTDVVHSLLSYSQRDYLLYSKLVSGCPTLHDLGG